MSDTEKIIRSIVKVADDRTKPVKKSFRFNLLKLLTGDNPETQNKIKSAIGNQAGWDHNCIQNLALNALQDLFFNAIDSIKEQRDPKLYGNDYYIKERHLEMMLEGYLEKVEELEEEIDKLNNDSITYEEHREEVKELKKLIKEKDNEIKRLEEKLISEREFAKEKEEYNESRLRKQIEYEMKVKKASTD
jgi:SMC interacting uncharacterized protein involved in chromosome segregation